MILATLSAYFVIGFVISQIVKKETKEKLTLEAQSDLDKYFSTEQLVIIVEIAIMVMWPVFLLTRLRE